MTKLINGFNRYDIDLINRGNRTWLLVAPGGRMCEVDSVEAHELFAELVKAVRVLRQTVEQFLDDLFSYKKNIMISTIY